MPIQDFGEKFDLTKLYLARDVAREITYELSSFITPGMTEEDAHAQYKNLCKKYAVEKQWHPPKIRFGPNTLKHFKEPSDPYQLQEEDLFFIDIGPVIEGHEADYGESFVIGNQFEHKQITQASKTVFEEVQNFWQTEAVSGPLLYEFARSRARFHGHELNMHSDGHRIGDFPHHVYFRGGLAECDERVIPDAWILEIHLSHPGNKFGAFFEDILTTGL
jgi:Xaa-Pro aminopeptidase